MGATNTTANYNLSQFIGTDKPAWLQDYNGDMLKIDTGINAAKVAADGAQNAASAAQNDATTANNAITNTINPAISSLNTTVGNQGGAINTINSLIGNGTPTTTDQTIIGAINEINAKVSDGFKKVYTSGNVEDALNDFYTLINTAKIGARSVLVIETTSTTYVLNYSGDKNSVHNFGSILYDGPTLHNMAYTARLDSNSCRFMKQEIFASTVDPTNIGTTSTVASIAIYY